ncbi:hypothetical protein [Oxynema aestuarii]|uniref:Uncharacterized protein n=1 Tax=Oxynema aestuarii AP17 TaxID=2064643 RepID=A0A6H1TSQ9_9CYAN|nr:hypothetical protein [Oxynema aestuarii]QIZ69246.1 hypothetical protein HCG48_00445 [Oxynema aestuarii AP17]
MHCDDAYFSNRLFLSGTILSGTTADADFEQLHLSSLLEPLPPSSL